MQVSTLLKGICIWVFLANNVCLGPTYRLNMRAFLYSLIYFIFANKNPDISTGGLRAVTTFRISVCIVQAPLYPWTGDPELESF